MPYKDPDPTDPNVLIGVMLPAEEETMREMAYAFAEEFVQMGYDAARLLAVFKNAFYAGAHGTYQALGEEAVRKIINECVADWGNIRFSILDSVSSSARVSEKDFVHPSTRAGRTEDRSNLAVRGEPVEPRGAFFTEFEGPGEIQNRQSKIQNRGEGSEDG